MPHMSRMTNGGIKLRIKEEDVVRARGILIINNSFCPNCNSINIKVIKQKWTVPYFLKMLLVSTVFFFYRKKLLTKKHIA